MSQQQSPDNVQLGQATANQQAAAVNSKAAPTRPAGGSPQTTMVSDMDQLKTKEPKLYKMISDTLAKNICEELKRHADRMKELYRENAKA